MNIFTKTFTVFFLGKNNLAIHQCQVTATTEQAAKIKGRSDLLANNLRPTDFLDPVITVVRPMQNGNTLSNTQGVA